MHEMKNDRLNRWNLSDQNDDLDLPHGTLVNHVVIAENLHSRLHQVHPVSLGVCK